MDSSIYMDDDHVNFIMCGICNAKIRGETLYKIHLTESRHLKNEDALVAIGKAKRGRPLPLWTSLTQYLDYLHLDEPIIGLKHLVRVERDGPELKYLCRLCSAKGDLSTITLHVLGRRHRQKYLMTKRPDLVTWEMNSGPQSGKLVRAKAEVVERQDGRGIPEEGNERQRGLKPQTSCMTVPPKEAPSLYKKQISYIQNLPKLLEIQPAGRFGQREMHKEINAFKMSHRGPSDGHEQGYIEEGEFRRTLKKKDDGHIRPSNLDRNPYRKRNPALEYFEPNYKERYPLKQNYREEESYDHRFPHKRPVSPKDEWHPSHPDSDRNSLRQLEQQDDRQRKEKEYKLLQLLHSQIQKFPHDGFTFSDADNLGDRIDFPRDFGCEDAYDKESRRKMEFNRKEEKDNMYERDTRGRGQYDRPQQGRRERTICSRDAFRGDDAGPSREPDDLSRKRMRLDPVPQHQVKDVGGTKNLTSKPSNVLDILKSIEIESMEEANFIKGKLCNLLEEFQANKSAKAASVTKAPEFSKNYNHISRKNIEFQQREGSAKAQWRETHSQQKESYGDSDSQGYYEDNLRPLAKRYESHSRDPQEKLPDRRQRQREEGISRGTSIGSDYKNRIGPRYPESATHSQEVWSHTRRSGMSSYSRDVPADETSYYHPSDSPSFSSPHFHTEPQYDTWRHHNTDGTLQPSSTLNKITSTLLQLVARKDSF